MTTSDDLDSAAYDAATDELDRWHFLFGANTTPEEANAALLEVQADLRRYINESTEAHHDEVAKLIARALGAEAEVERLTRERDETIVAAKGTS